MILEYSPKLLPEEVPEFTKDILSKLKPFCTDSDLLFDIKLALEEALINAVKYGNKSDKEKCVFVKIEATDQELVIEIKDQGQGFDFNNVASPTSQDNLEKLSGRGVFLIKNFMDKVEYFDKGSKIRMVKSLIQDKKLI
ncbi:MAG: ATP-binding protein [Candidatus Omnitrophica bacterium]|nr:ATP-binding protein [Candidatus Omnitrophota bacterium]